MHNWTILVLAVGLFAWGVFSRRLEHSVVTPAMFFVTFGLFFGPEGTGSITLDVGGKELRGVAELTLTLVLFTDASRLNLRALRQDYPLPARLLGVGLPLTIGLGDRGGQGALRWAHLVGGRIGGRHPGTDRRRAWAKRSCATRGYRSGSARASTSRAGSTTGSACRSC